MSSIAPTNEASNVTSLPSTPKTQTAKEVIAANVKLLIEQLEAGHSEGLTAYLTAMGRFHRYSFSNVLEIARQMPSASRVAGMYAWNQLGRKVKKGSKGIRILAPVVGIRRKKDSEAEKDLTKQNEPVLVGFRSAYVFDVSMTDGSPLPNLKERVKGDVGEYRERLIDFILAQGRRGRCNSGPSALRQHLNSALDQHERSRSLFSPFRSTHFRPGLKYMNRFEFRDFSAANEVE